MDKSLKLRLILQAAGNAVSFLKGVKGQSDQTAKALSAAADRVRTLSATARNVQAYRALETRLTSTRRALSEAQAEAGRLARAHNHAEKPTKALARALEIAKAKVRELKDQETTRVRGLQTLRAKLAEAGVSTKNLGAWEARLARETRQANEALKEQARRANEVADRQRRMGAAHDRYAKTQQFAGSVQGAGASALGAGVVMGAPMVAGVLASNELQTNMTTIAQRSNMSAAATAVFERRMLAASKAANQTREETTATFDALTAQGFDAAPALAIAQAVGRAATAYNEEGRDIAVAAGSLRNLKIEAGETARTLDVMAVAGKRGNFEFGDMARAFPSLTAQAEALGIKGVTGAADLAAALQIVRRGAGSSEEAATALGNVMQKMTSPETERRFAKLGFNLRNELANAAKAGISPLEAIIELTRRATGGDMTKLGYLFEDAQVQQGLRPLIAATADYRQIRTDALKANGEVDNDFARRMKDNAEAVKAMKISADAASISVGKNLAPMMTGAAQFATSALDAFNAWSQANPGLAKGLTFVLAGVAALLVVGGALALGVSAILGPFALLQLSLTQSGILFGPLGGKIADLGGKLFGFAGKALPMVGRGLAVAGRGFLAFGGMAARAGLMLLANPITWIVLGIVAAVALLAGAGYLIYRNWGAISAWLGNLWTSIKAATVNAVGFMTRLFMTFSPVGILIGAVMRAWPALQALGGRFLEMGRHLLTGLINGVLGGIPGLVAAVMRAGGAVVTAFKQKLGIHSPSRVFAQLGDYTMQGLGIGLGRSTRDPLRRIRSAATALTAAGAMALGPPALAGPDFDTSPRLAAGAAARPPASVQPPVTIGTLNLTIVQRPGEDMEALAKRVAELLQNPTSGAGDYGDDDDDYGEAP